MDYNKPNRKQDPQLASRKKQKPTEGKLALMNSVGCEIVLMNFKYELKSK